MNSRFTAKAWLKLNNRSLIMPDQHFLDSNDHKLAVCLSLLLATFCPPAMADSALLLTGYTIDSSDTRAGAANQDLAAALLQLGISGESAGFAESLDGQVRDALQAYEAAVSALSDAQPAQPFAQLYSPCMMILATDAGGSGIRLPDNSGSIVLERWNQTTGEAFSAVLAAATGGQEHPGTTTHQAPDWLKPNGESETLLGYQALGYSGVPADQDMVVEPESGDSTVGPRPGQDGYHIAVAVEFQQSYSAWIATGVTGNEITRHFLKNMHRLLLPEHELHPLFQGHLQRQAEFLELGIALLTIESEDSRIGGSTVSNTTRESRVSSIHLIDTTPELCFRSFIPADFQQLSTTE